jgi:hypothetical protein
MVAIAAAIVFWWFNSESPESRGRRKRAQHHQDEAKIGKAQAERSERALTGRGRAHPGAGGYHRRVSGGPSVGVVSDATIVPPDDGLRLFKIIAGVRCASWSLRDEAALTLHENRS